MYKQILCICVSILGLTNIILAQTVDTISIKTFAKENPKVQFHYRKPANYDITSKSKSRLLIYFGGRNTTGEAEVYNQLQNSSNAHTTTRWKIRI